MSLLEKLLADFRRLLQSRTPPAESIDQPSADRPPPPESASLEPAPSVETAPTQEPTAPHVIPTTPDDIAEVRAALEAVAAAPESAPEIEAEPPPAPEPPPPLFPASTPTSPSVANEAAVDVTSAAPAPVGDALILTLATPAATFTIARSGATLGRGQENTIRLDDLSVSRRHARIAYRQGGYWLSDLGSMGGTWIGGTRLNAPRRIAAGEVIDIGHCRLRVSFAEDPMKAETKKSTNRPRSEMAAPGRRRR